MHKGSIQTIGRSQTSRENPLFFIVSEVEELLYTFDNDFSWWSDFDNWKNIGVQKWIFARAIDVYWGMKIDIKFDCCKCIHMNQSYLKISANQISFGQKNICKIEKGFRFKPY